MIRSGARLARAGSAACAAAAALIALAWITGRIASDRTLPTQWLSWIPAILALPAIAGLLGLSWWQARLGRRPRAHPPARRTRRAVVLLGVIGIAWILVADWRVLSSPSGAAPASRILFWNPSGADLEPMADRVASESPDILLMVNPNRRRWAFEIASAIGARAGAGPAHVAFGVQIACISRDPILAWGFTELGLHGRISRKAWLTDDQTPDTGGIDRGRAMYIVIDAARWFGRPLVVWVVDLPSDAGLARPAMMDQARRAIDGFSGTEYHPADDGRWIAARVEGGFPPADVIVGDLNTPRGAASIPRLVGPSRDAWRSGGRGYAATWPRRAPLWHIDQAFITDELECVGYRVIDFGRSEHRAIAIDVAPQRVEKPR